MLKEIKKKSYHLRPGNPNDKMVVDVDDIETIFGEYKCFNCKHYYVVEDNNYPVAMCDINDMTIQCSFCSEIELEGK